MLDLHFLALENSVKMALHYRNMLEFDVRESVHHSTIHKENPNKMQ